MADYKKIVEGRLFYIRDLETAKKYNEEGLHGLRNWESWREIDIRGLSFDENGQVHYKESLIKEVTDGRISRKLL